MQAAPAPTRIVEDLQASICRCGRLKRNGKAFCRDCFRYLPADVQQGLYLPVGRGYEEGLRQANQILLFRDPPRGR